MPFVIVFFIGVLVGVCVAYYFAGVSAMRERLVELERQQNAKPASHEDPTG